MKFKISSSVTIISQFVLNRLYSATISIHESQDLHTFSHYSIPIVIHIGKILRSCFSIQASRIHNLNAIIILIKLNRTVSFVVSMTNGVHQQFTGRPMRIIKPHFFSKR